MAIVALATVYSNLTESRLKSELWEGPDTSKGFPLGYNPITKTYRYRDYPTDINPNRKIIKETKNKSRKHCNQENDFNIEEAIQYYMD